MLCCFSEAETSDRETLPVHTLVAAKFTSLR